MEAWEKLGKLRKHEPSPREIRDLVGVVERELEYARAISRGAKLGEEGEFNHAYEAARTGFWPDKRQLQYRRFALRGGEDGVIVFG